MAVTFDPARKYNFLDLVDGNLAIQSQLINATQGWAFLTEPVSGKQYVEFYLDQLHNESQGAWIGVGGGADFTATLTDGIGWRNDGYIFIDNATIGVRLGSWQALTGGVVMMAVDAAAGLVWFGINGVWQNGNPAAGTDGQAYDVSGKFIGAAVLINNSLQRKITGRFSAASFTYTPPAGFVAPDGPAGGTTHEGAASLSGTGTATGTARRAAKGSAVVSGTGSLAATSKLRRKGAAVLSGTSALVATVKLNRKGAAALSGTGTLAATAKATRNAAALLAGTGTLTATATTSSGQSGAASFTGTGTMSAAATLTAGAAASLTGTGTISAAAQAVRGASAALMGQGALGALARLETNAAAVLAGVGTMTVVGRSEAPRRATTSLRAASHAQRPRQVSTGTRPAAVSMGRR